MAYSAIGTGLVFFLANLASSQDSRPSTDSAPVRGDLEVRWIHGSKEGEQNTDPPIQVHRYDPSTFILRQSKAVHYEAPFIYLLLGKKRALLIDTGATASGAKFPIRDTVKQILLDSSREKGQAAIELIVAHSHAHGDHVAGDKQFAGDAATTVVGRSPKDVAAFFGIDRWPDQVVRYDLGGRILDIIPIPGHEASSIAIHDEKTGLLLTGDTLYPGRLYVENWDDYRASVARLAAFATKHHVSHVLGAHIEMTKNPGVDYAVRTRFQPDEHVLQLEARHLDELRLAVQKMGDKPAREIHDDFIIWPR